MNQTEINPRISSRLSERKKSHRFRNLQPVSGKPSAARLIQNGEEFINFSNNDYLGLSKDPVLIQSANEFTERYGTGSASSRLITGTLDIHLDLEEKLAALYQRDRILLYSTGFQANSTILPAITGKGDLILADKKCHNSILTGCIASRAEWQRFRHNDPDHLEHLLKKADSASPETLWIITESIFSMDGDTAPLQDLISLSRKFGARLYVDDAHGIGVYGKSGLGCTEGMEEIDLVVGTFGKAAGSFGAFVACSHLIAETLVNFSNGFIYTTALPPAVVGAVDAAFDRIPDMKAERNQLLKISRYAVQSLNNAGFNTGSSFSHILPVIIGEDQKTEEMSEQLHRNRIFASAIRPPTVPEGESRIRLSVTSDHTQNDIDLLTEALHNG